MELGGRGLRVRRLGGNRAGEIRLTRFLRNPSVTPEAMAREASARTSGRCAGRTVLAIQDTTVVRSAGGGGLYLHPTLAVDAESGAILGLAHASFLSRTRGKAADRRSRPIGGKESGRWLEGAQRAAEACARARQLIHIADREADIFALFALRPQGSELIVRAAHDRALEDGGRLFAAVDALPAAAAAELDLPAGPAARPGRPRSRPGS